MCTEPSGLAVGFLTVLDIAPLGYCGGYLLLDRFGCPLEFHCTLPVMPTQTQEILYGPNLREFLYSEAIGHAMLSKAKLPPEILLANQAELLSIRRFVQCPVVLVTMGDDQDTTGGDRTQQKTSSEGLETQRSESRWADGYQIHGFQIRYAEGWSSDPATAETVLEDVSRHIVLDEPFARIEEAIRQAHAVSRTSQPNHEHEESRSTAEPACSPVEKPAADRDSKVA